MPYSAMLGSTTPGTIIFLLDQSLSMEEPFGESGTRMEIAANAINRTIAKIVSASKKGKEVSPRVFISAIGYGDGVKVLLNDTVDEINDNVLRVEMKERKTFDGIDTVVSKERFPVWIEPVADGATPMLEAFQKAKEIAEEKCLEYPKSFPPIIVNITDGYPYPDTDKQQEEIKKIAKEIKSLSTNDGNVLIVNAHISGQSINTVIFPSNNSGFANDKFANFLFEISSNIPKELLSKAQDKMTKEVSEESKCMVYNGKVEDMIGLLEFGTIPMTDGK